MNVDGKLAVPLLFHDPVRHTLRTATGFSLIDLVIVMALIATLSSIAIPTIQNVGDAIALGEAQRVVQSELQKARLKAVTANRMMRVRFNCPTNGQLRMVELIGTPKAPAPQDTAANRCSEAVYPFPAADLSPLTMPNHDGPIRRIDQRVSFGAVQTIEFRPTGEAYAVNADGTSGASLGDGVSVTVTKGSAAKTVTVNGLGKVQAQ
jgi:type II secretory pathway pseudopilin PulG